MTAVAKPPVDVRVEVATPDRWNDLVDLFGTKGAAAHCWCQWFMTDEYFMSPDQVDLCKEGMRTEIGKTPPPGVLAYHDDIPVGWLRVSPLTRLPRLASGRTFKTVASAEPDAPEGVWQAACFVVKVGYRRSGISAALLHGGIEYARDQGARTLIGHPVDVNALDKRPSGAELYTGALTTFLNEGFKEFARTTPHRPLVRLPLTA